MLHVYVDVLNAIIKGSGGGEEMTIGKISKSVGLSYHKTKKALLDLHEFGMVFAHDKQHRPNKIKTFFDATMVGQSWVLLMNMYRMEGM